LAGEAGMLLHMLGGFYSGEMQATKAGVERLCKGLISTNPAPQIGGVAHYANRWGFLKAWRQRSRGPIEQLLKLASLLEAEHVALISKIDQCEYFRMLDGSMVPTGNGDLGWLAGMMWDYVERANVLGEYLVRLTNRRTQK
jgi:hypothetical protein